jgi:beta-glucosidase-like glycosyl hydrolase
VRSFFSAVNGVPACANADLMTGWLREGKAIGNLTVPKGWDGYVISEHVHHPSPPVAILY